VVCRGGAIIFGTDLLPIIKIILEAIFTMNEIASHRAMALLPSNKK
jgi:hypothetical protein